MFGFVLHLEAAPQCVGGMFTWLPKWQLNVIEFLGELFLNFVICIVALAVYIKNLTGHMNCIHSRSVASLPYSNIYERFLCNGLQLPWV